VTLFITTSRDVIKSSFLLYSEVTGQPRTLSDIQPEHERRSLRLIVTGIGLASQFQKRTLQRLFLRKLSRFEPANHFQKSAVTPSRGPDPICLTQSDSPSASLCLCGRKARAVSKSFSYRRNWRAKETLQADLFKQPSHVIPNVPRSKRPPSFRVDGGQVPAYGQSMAGGFETVPRGKDQFILSITGTFGNYS
jgi:hypothetical protein